VDVSIVHRCGDGLRVFLTSDTASMVELGAADVTGVSMCFCAVLWVVTDTKERSGSAGAEGFRASIR
jgi:hypothetical protein